jgi:2-polyprenyl-3-methyl-5-hydroxy-6-metoxy-1,4-benzoquinol methylase
MEDYLEKAKRAETEFWDKKTKSRTAFGQIPLSADIRRATRFIPSAPDQEPIDPQMTCILQGDYRARFIDYVAHRPRGRVLDIGCGMGWLALELGRRGQTVDAYDFSPEAIAVARRMLDENPYKDGFGKVTYHLEDVTKLDLGNDTFDAVSGWAAFHHLPDVNAFTDQVQRALKPDGIVASLDCLPRGRIEEWIERFFRLVLPTYDRTYRQKIRDSIRRISGITQEQPRPFTPMECADAVHDLESIWCEKFEVVWNINFNAFAGTPCMVLIGPDWFRYAVAHAITGLDRLLCRMGICRGFIRIMIARKR